MTDTSSYYEEQAIHAKREAETATLQNVRERAARAAQRWRVLAAQARQVEAERAKKELLGRGPVIWSVPRA